VLDSFPIPLPTRLPFAIQPQPDDTTCGPTCLHAVYRYYGDDLALEDVVEQTRRLEGGGTLAVYLALHALSRGYEATIYTYNLQVFDPTWFQPGAPDLRERLRLRAQRRRSPKLRAAATAYREFLDRGGEIRFEDLTTALLRRHLRRGVPVLTGLNATYLNRWPRERVDGHHAVEDDVGGDPMGHFVVVHGYQKKTRQALVADPLADNANHSHHYSVPISRLQCAILLGIMTYDANLLMIEPPLEPS